MAFTLIFIHLYLFRTLIHNNKTLDFPNNYVPQWKTAHK